LPTSDLGLNHLAPYIPAAEVDSTVRIGHGALPPSAVALRHNRQGHGWLPRLDTSLCRVEVRLATVGKRAEHRRRSDRSHRIGGKVTAAPLSDFTPMGKAEANSPDSELPDTSWKNPSWKTEVLLPGSWRGATSTLLSRGHHHIIIDTGMPHEAHRLLEELEKRGLHPSDIRMIVNTHFHVDHVLNNCLFPDSEIYGSQQSHDWCCQAYADLLDEQNWEKLSLKYYPESAEYERAPKLMGALRRFALRWWDRKRLGDPSRFRWIETQPLPDDLEFLVTNGHVPGHASVIVHNGDQPIIIAGDAVLTREHDANVFTMIPHNREQFQHDRAHILAMMGRIVPGHDGEFSNRSEDPPASS